MVNYGSGMMQSHAPMGNTYACLPMNDKVEKIALPKFSGKRRDWPEFKAVWQKLTEGSFRETVTKKSDIASVTFVTEAADSPLFGYTPCCFFSV